uniref:Microfibril associated protein 2 n=1 Tax=Esox lucius TaxID=8010 RepID=A0A3P9A0X4_ESOLU
MRVLLLLSMPVLLLAQPPLYQEPFPFLGEFIYIITTLSAEVQQQVLLQGPRPFPGSEHPGPSDCREEQYPCTRLYSVHKPCKQCLNSLCFYSLRRVYLINKEVCVRTVCAHEELLRADMCRDQFSRCGVAAVSGQCGVLGSSCGKSCGGC